MDKKSESPLKASIEYTVDYRNVKYPRLEFKTGSLLLVLPRDYRNEEDVLKKHQKWIRKKTQTINNALHRAKHKQLNLKRTRDELRNLVQSSIQNFECELRTKVGKLFFRKMRTKWASYSKNGNLTINTQLRFLPKELIEYVIFHEMTHALEKRHNDTFWKIVNRKYPHYKDKEQELLIHWFLIQKKLNPQQHNQIRNLP